MASASGLGQRISRTELTPTAFFERSAAVFPERVAVVHEDRRYTYREFAERARRLGSALRNAGLAKHDRVAILSPNTPAMLETRYSVPASGGILVAINTRLSADEIHYILKNSGKGLKRGQVSDVAARAATSET